MVDANDRRDIIRTLMESEFYFGTPYRMPLQERLGLVQKLEQQMVQNRNGQRTNSQLQGRHNDV